MTGANLIAAFVWVFAPYAFMAVALLAVAYWVGYYAGRRAGLNSDAAQLADAAFEVMKKHTEKLK